MSKYAGQSAPDAHARAFRQDTTAPEPWTDAIDEIDARELAMKRFRTRQELLSDIFGPEQLSECGFAGLRGGAGFEGMFRVECVEERVEVSVGGGAFSSTLRHRLEPT